MVIKPFIKFSIEELEEYYRKSKAATSNPNEKYAIRF